MTFVKIRHKIVEIFFSNWRCSFNKIFCKLRFMLVKQVRMEMVLQNSSLSKYVSDTFIIMYYKKNSTINRHYIEKKHVMIV